MRLIQALRPPDAPRLALVGAGGKTSALFSLARDLVDTIGLPARRAAPAVLVSTTTHLARSQVPLADHHRIIYRAADLTSLESEQISGVLLVTGPGSPADPDRLSGLEGGSLDRLLTLADLRGLPLLIEADGSRLRPLKSPANHEPAIPSFVDIVIVVAGLSGLGNPLNEEWVHRPERFGVLSGLSPGEMITPEAVAQILVSPLGGLKNIPPKARRVALLSQANSGELKRQADGIAVRLLPAFHSVIIAEQGDGADGGKLLVPYKVYEPVAGILLAGGASLRYGRPKQLLTWQGEAFVRRAAKTALEAGLSPVVVVTGAHAELVQQAVSGLDVVVTFNESWIEGQSRSVQAGLKSLPSHTGAAVFLLADQPQVPAALIRALVEAHALTGSPLAAPRIGERRANPVLMDRTTFPALMNLSGDAGGRLLFADPSRYPVAWVPWDDPSLLLDVDTPEDYRRLVELDREE